MSRNTSPIFIVGVPRSGTTLLAAMLAAHSRLSCGPETRFFHFLARTKPESLLESWPERAVDFLCSITLIEPVPVHYGFDREQLFTVLAAKQPSVQAILSALTEEQMCSTGKQRWVEKSPEHLMTVHEVRRYFPHAPIIRIVRDPRDVALSMNRTPWAPQDYLDALFLWRSYDEQSRSFFEADGNAYSLHYEDLVVNPETELKQLCSFLEEGFEPQMLNTAASATLVATTGEPWKRNVFRPIDESRVHAWKHELDCEQKRLSEAIVGDRLAAYGYDGMVPWRLSATVRPSLATIIRYRRAVRLLSDADIKFWSADKHTDLLVFAGSPDRDGWLSPQKPQRWLDLLGTMLLILRKKLAGQRIVWVAKEADRDVEGWSTRLLVVALRFAGNELLNEDYQ